MKNWLVYLLECSDKTLYCGCTNNFPKRYKEHNEGKASKYTRARLPTKLVAWSIPLTKGKALHLEYLTKQQPKNEKINFLQNYKEE